MKRRERLAIAVSIRLIEGIEGEPRRQGLRMLNAVLADSDREWVNATLRRLNRHTRPYRTGPRPLARNKAILAAYLDGRSIRQIAGDYGLAYQRIQQVVDTTRIRLRNIAREARSMIAIGGEWW